MILRILILIINIAYIKRIIRSIYRALMINYIVEHTANIVLAHMRDI